MKLLESLIKQQPKYTHKQIIKWLYWLRDNCDGRSCPYCEFHKLYCACEVIHAYKDLVSTLKTPGKWNLLRKGVFPEKPPSLEFLRHIHWSKKGNPVPPPKKGE